MHNFKKNLGQNFIQNINTVFEIVEHLHLSGQELVIEIGAGDGKFSELIAEKAGRLVTIEFDHELIPTLKELLSNKPITQVIQADILEVNLPELISEYKEDLTDVKIFGALPYNISKPIIRKCLEMNVSIKQMIFIIQKEVAKKYVAQSPDTNILSLTSQIFGQINYLNTLPREYFYPQPKVESATIEILPHQDINPEKYASLIKFIKNGFRTPRKKLKNSLKSIYKDIDWSEAFSLSKLGENTRASELDLSSWQNLFENSLNIK